MKKNFSPVFKIASAFLMTAIMSVPNMATAEDAQKVHMPRATPESQEVNPELILNTLRALKNDEIHSLLMARNGNIIFEGYWTPYSANSPHITHSLTKVFSNTAVGIAYTQGAFDKFGGLKAKVVDVLADFKDEKGKGIKELHRTAFGEGDEQQAAFEKSWERLQKITLLDLLYMRSGMVSIGGNQWRPLRTSWLANWFAQPMQDDPGTVYLYSSANSYVLSAMAQQVMGKTAYNILMENGFTDMGMDFTWSTSPENICSGGNGVTATTEDLLKMGQLYLNKGLWNGKRILSEEWCDLSLGLKIAIDKDILAKYPSYDGFHWEASAPQGQPNNGIYIAKGKFGQTIAVDVKTQTVFATTSGTPNYEFAHERIMPNFNLALRNPNPNSNRMLSGEKLRIMAEHLSYWPQEKSHDSEAVQKLQQTINGKAFKVKEATSTTGKISEIDQKLVQVIAFQFNIEKDKIDLLLSDGRGTHVISNGLTAPIASKTSMTGNYMHHQYQTENEPVVALATWLDDSTLRMIWRYPQMAFVDTLTIKFEDNGNKASVTREVSVTSEVKSMSFKGTL